MIKLRLYYLLVLSLVLLGCKKEDNTLAAQLSILPAATQTGANVVAWNTNGAAYVADSGKTSCTVQIDTNRTYNLLNTGSFRIQTSYIDSGGYKRAILLTSPANTNVPLPISGGTAFGIVAYSDNALYEQAISGSSPLTLPTTGGQITITYCDLSKKILAGTFQFATLPSGSATSRNVSGWFDLKISMYEHD
jgi:hypothetical protein